MLCCFGFRTTCNVQMITGLVPCDNHCAIVYLFEVLLALCLGLNYMFGIRVCLVFVPVHGTL